MLSLDRRAVKVLVAEDDESIRELLVTRLELAGYRTAEARDGEAALERWSVFHPNLAIVDINMPRVDGFGLLAAARARGQLVRTPVMMLTARNARSDIERARALGATDYLVKPFDDQQLLQRVARLLRTGPNAVARPPLQGWA